MSKHTPGQWSAVEVGHYGAGDNIMPLFEVQSSECAVVCENIKEADALLIAAAPAMLESLEDLLEAADALRQTCEVILGIHPEKDDTHIHEQWAEKLLTEKAEAVRAVIRAAKGEA